MYFFNICPITGDIPQGIGTVSYEIMSLSTGKIIFQYAIFLSMSPKTGVLWGTGVHPSLENGQTNGPDN
ncbi:hypothetical protein [Flagellimonas sp.]|uniref:hypothetical protein n=1 Tax=Flagellimonas sp. TaxID=2058762 RepID=UPI003BA97FF3